MICWILKGNTPDHRAILPFPLSCLHRHIADHIFNKDPIPHARIIYHNMRHRTDEPSVLNHRAAAHECVQVGTTHFLQIIDRFDTNS